jgi:hypothetical protein
MTKRGAPLKIHPKDQKSEAKPAPYGDPSASLPIDPGPKVPVDGQIGNPDHPPTDVHGNKQ